MAQPLTADAKRLRVVIVSFPLFVATSWVLYKRAYLGEQQRTIPPKPSYPVSEGINAGQSPITGSDQQNVGRTTVLPRRLEAKGGL